MSRLAPQTPPAGDSADLNERLLTFRRDLHRHPELGLHVPCSRDRVVDELADLDLEIKVGRALDSVTAVMRGLRPGPSVLLRAELDALPVHEEADLPFRSLRDGVMHACGHDLNAAMLLGAAHVLARQRKALAGDIVFMFQPGEEGHAGGRQMVAEGVLEASGTRVTAAFALHVAASGMPRGVFSSRVGAITASADRIQITVRGRGGHASAPHLARDPIQPASAIVMALSGAISRRTEPAATSILSIGAIHGGDAANVIPRQVELAGTIRSLDADGRRALIASVKEISAGIALAYGVEVDVEVTAVYPQSTNDADCVDLVGSTVSATLGSERWETMEQPLTGAEDFAYVLEEVPGALIFLGATPRELDHRTAPYNHAPDAVFDDELVMDGARVLAALALRSIEGTLLRPNSPAEVEEVRAKRKSNRARHTATRL